MSSTTKRRSTDSRINAGNNIGNSPSAPTTVTATESQDRKPASGDDKKDKGEDVTCLSNGVPLVPPPSATVPPSNGVVDDVPLSESPPKTPLASNQKPPTTIIQPSSPPSTSSPAPADPARSSPLDGLRSSRNSLTSSRPAPPSPATSRRASGALSRCSSTRSRPNSTPAAVIAAAAAPPDANTNADSKPGPGAPSPTTPTPQQQARKSCSSSGVVVKIRDFAFPDDDPRHTGLGPLTPRPNRRMQRPLSAWSASSTTSSTSSNDDDGEDDDDNASSSAGAGGSSYGFAGWGLGRLSWFGVRSSGAADSATVAGAGVASGGGGGGPSQGDFERNFEDAISPSYEIDDPYASLDDSDSDDDFDDYEDNVGEDNVEHPLVPGLYRALYAFEPEGTAEMALEEDQIVRVVGRGGGVGWAIVARDGEEGHALVPEGYLELISLDQEQEQLGEEDG